MSDTLRLAVKRVYFDSIVAGTKGEEYRLVTPYWTRRIEGRVYDAICITLGYPSAGDPDKTLYFPWNGYKRKRITHPHFGPDEVEVYEIDLSDGEL